MRRAIGVLAAGLLFGVASPAEAAITVTGAGQSTALTINGSTSVGDSVTVLLNGQANGTVYASLGAALTLTFEGTASNASGGTNYLFNYVIANTSTPASTARVTAFGFDITPLANFDLAKTTIASGGTYDMVSSGSLANNSLNFCLKNGQNNNCGGSQGGPSPGQSGTGAFTLYFDTVTNSITLSGIEDRYQGITGTPGSAEGFVTRVVPPVPEPATWAMMLIGFGGMGVALRRQRRRAGLPQIA